MGYIRVQRLDSRYTTLVIDCGGSGMPCLIYWGRRLETAVDADTLNAATTRPVPDGGLDDDLPLTLLPEAASGFVGQPGLEGSRGRRDWLTCFELTDVTCSQQRLTIDCVDRIAALALRIELQLDNDSGVLATRAQLTNAGDTVYALDWCAAAVMPLPLRADELLTLEGRWSREFQMRRQPFPNHKLVGENRAGRTSHNVFPGVIAGEPGFGEQSGEVFGFTLGWSGNHRWVAEHLRDGRHQIQLGEWLYPGEIELAPGESYTSPTSYAAWSGDGLSTLSAAWHGFVRRQILPAKTPCPRPVHINTWEAFYFAHDLAQLKSFAESAANLGVERFVLDDGWFKGRDDATRALGDWIVDSAKYPNGLDELIDHVRERGLEFGLWVEPEMVNPDSELYRAHPDWILALDERTQPMGRGQYVLDLSQPAVSDYLFGCLDDLLTAYDIAYLKWDMNRDLTHPGHDGIAAVHRQTERVYALIDRLRARHPGVEIESCASGGARADFEILRRTDRIWVSDCNDAIERQRIQRGFSLFFPPEVMGAHIGPSPAHTTGRQIDFDFQAATALFGHFGLELDILSLTSAERARLAAWIGFYKENRDLLHGGCFERLDVDEDQCLAYGVVGRDGDRALFCYARLDSARESVPPPLRLAGLDPHRNYRVRLRELPSLVRGMMKKVPASFLDEGTVLTGEWTMNAGMQLPICPPQSAFLLELDAITRVNAAA